MINDFPPLIKDEMVFGYIYRYHVFSGNLNFSDTAQEVWGKNNQWIYSILFPAVASSLIEKMGITQHDYILKHTVIPFYKIFIMKEKYEQLEQNIFSNNRYFSRQLFKGMKIIYDHRSINYCPLCMEENYNIPLILRQHNVDGIFVCTKHKCYLNKLSWEKERIRDILRWDILDRTVKYTNNQMLLDVANDVHYILNNNIELDLYKIRNILYKVAVDKGYVNVKGDWLEHKMHLLRINFHDIPEEYTEIIQYISFKRMASEKLPYSIHPLHYILAINQLYGNFDNFLKSNEILS